ncbi:BamA/TamA family outer membrane protein [Maribellus mangrovi]|uniref:BamA/TamA family outer membrane protein n=1 Tax=Maribellus mangrovi TaxID=3133146 RepID=UPI0030ECC15A
MALRNMPTLQHFDKVNIHDKDTVEDNSVKKVSKFDEINKKAEELFKIIPVPIISYSQEAGNVFGLTKFNAFRIDKNDTLSDYSKISEVFTFSTKGHINASISTNLNFSENKWMVMGYVNYKKRPEYILGIGNDVKKEDAELITIDRVKFFNIVLRNITSHFYLGTGVDLNNTFKVEKDSTSFLIKNNITGKDGGFTLGLGLTAAWDSRDNKYNAHTGTYALLGYLYYPKVTDVTTEFHTFQFDLRHFFVPWKKHVIAMQLATNYSSGDVPFYELSKLGGEERMRGYYEGALRDKVLLDGQIEYRMPVWKIFGIVGWVGCGRVADKYSNLSLDGFRPSYGLGLRIKVDSASDINMRLDFGKGIKGVSGFYINFAEAF